MDERWSVRKLNALATCSERISTTLARSLRALRFSCNFLVGTENAALIRRVLEQSGSLYHLVICALAIEELAALEETVVGVVSLCVCMDIPCFAVVLDEFGKRVKIHSPGVFTIWPELLEDLSFQMTFEGRLPERSVLSKIVRRVISTELYNFPANRESRARHRLANSCEFNWDVYRQSVSVLFPQRSKPHRITPEEKEILEKNTLIRFEKRDKRKRVTKFSSFKKRIKKAKGDKNCPKTIPLLFNVVVLPDPLSARVRGGKVEPLATLMKFRSRRPA